MDPRPIAPLAVTVLLVVAGAACAPPVVIPDCPGIAEQRCTSDKLCEPDTARNCIMCVCERQWYERSGDQFATTPAPADAAAKPAPGDAEEGTGEDRGEDQGEPEGGGEASEG